ncbi:MAG: arsenate reductase, glutathione/glutaredoxin type [Synechocystis sp.]
MRLSPGVNAGFLYFINLCHPIFQDKPMKNVMFVCKRNSCRSQMAEGFAKTLGADKITVTSCGLEASRVHPTAIEMMQEVGIDITDQTSDPIEAFNAEDYDVVISLCGCGVNLPPDWVMQEVFEDWQLEDPDGKSLEVFREVRGQVKERVEGLIAKLS